MPDRYGDLPDLDTPPATQEDFDARAATLAVRAAEVAACGMCDADGYRGSVVCDHGDHRPAYVRGLAACREALREGNAND